MQSAEEWRRQAENKKNAATELRDKRRLCRECYHLTGVAIEFALKAVVMKNERFNQWPSKAARPDLYVHNLRALFNALNVSHSGLPIELRANLKTVLNWSRGAEYADGKMPRKELIQFYNAAFGPDGVYEWLKTL